MDTFIEEEKFISEKEIRKIVEEEIRKILGYGNTKR